MIPPLVTTDRLTLPLWTASDVAAIRAGAPQPGWHDDFPREDDRDAASLWHDGDPWGPRSIVRGATTLGSIGFFGAPSPAADGVAEVEVGYGLVPQAWGWGLATEALRSLVGLTDAAGVRVRAPVLPDNARSIKVLAKCGFTRLRGTTEDGELVLVHEHKLVRPLSQSTP